MFLRLRGEGIEWQAIQQHRQLFVPWRANPTTAIYRAICWGSVASASKHGKNHQSFQQVVPEQAGM
jgi:hypothetical protein